MKNFEPEIEKNLPQYIQHSRTSVKHNLSISDFTIIRHLGQGAFGKVYLVKNNNTGSHHAVKAMSKELVVKKRFISYLKNEKTILGFLKFPFVIHLESYFIDNSFVYLIIPFVSGGNLADYLIKSNRFEENLARFYAAQLVLGLEYLHSLDVLHRDIKPQNILVEPSGYLKITDFGFAKVVKLRTFSMCGSPEYIAPEIIAGRGYGKAVDWWSLGILVFEMASGDVPFYHVIEMKMYELEASNKYKMPNYFSSELKNFVGNLIQTDLSKRLGNLKNGMEDIKKHPWFRPIVWSSVFSRTMKPLFVPEESSLLEEEQVQEDIVLHIECKNSFEKEFEDF